MKIYKQWLADDDNNILFKPLSFWFEYFGIVPGYSIDGYQYWKTKAGKRIDIELCGGYGLKQSEYESKKNNLFFVGNADLDVWKVREKY